MEKEVDLLYTWHSQNAQLVVSENVHTVFEACRIRRNESIATEVIKNLYLRHFLPLYDLGVIDVLVELFAMLSIRYNVKTTYRMLRELDKKLTSLRELKDEVLDFLSEVSEWVREDDFYDLVPYEALVWRDTYQTCDKPTSVLEEPTVEKLWLLLTAEPMPVNVELRDFLVWHEEHGWYDALVHTLLTEIREEHDPTIHCKCTCNLPFVSTLEGFSSERESDCVWPSGTGHSCRCHPRNLE